MDVEMCLPIVATNSATSAIPALLSRLKQSARPLMAPSVDVGFGLVQAPQ